MVMMDRKATGSTTYFFMNRLVMWWDQDFLKLILFQWMMVIWHEQEERRMEIEKIKLWSPKRTGEYLALKVCLSHVYVPVPY